MKRVHMSKIIIYVLLVYILIIPIEVNASLLKVVNVGGDNNYPPYEFLDNENNFRGFNVDIMKAIGIELGIEIDLIPMTWEEAMNKLISSDIDMVQGMTRSSLREEIFEFSDPLIINSQAIFVRSDTNDVASLQDLNGKKVSFQKADVSIEISDKIKNIERVVRENQEEAIEMLLDEEVDAFIGNRYTGIYYLQRSNNSSKVKIVGSPMHETEYCIAVKKDNKDILEDINKGLKNIKLNGTYDKIYNKWFGEEIHKSTEYLIKWIKLIFFFLILSFLILILNFYWNKVLKNRVDERTRELDIKNSEIEEQKNKINNSNILRGTILESILSGIIVFDNKDNLIEYNTASEKLLDKKFSIGNKYEDLDIDKLGLIGYEEAKEGLIYKDNKKIIINSKEHYYNYNYIPINNKDKGIILLINDYTDIELYQKMASYSDKMQALGELSGGIAHEIRNPLTSIKTFIDLIPYKIDDEKFKKELVDICNKEIQRMDDLITQLIDYTKPMEKKMSNYLLEELIEDILLLFKNILVKNNISVDLDLESIEIYGDENQIKQVLVNIILNSIDAIDRTGVIRITTRLIGENKVEVIIWDNGRGIPESDLDSIFNPFFTNKKDGTGIGLAISKKIVLQNNGSIKIDSKENKWTKVSLILYTK